VPPCHMESAPLVAVMPFRTFGALYPSIEANGRVEFSVGPAGPVGWRASFLRFRVNGAPGLLATTTEKIERDYI